MDTKARVEEDGDNGVHGVDRVDDDHDNDNDDNVDFEWKPIIKTRTR